MTATGTLLIFGGLPGVGKTTLARAIARRLGAVYLRIDSIEDALAECSLRIRQAEDAGYAAAYSVAEDNLRNGLTVVADSVNPIAITREAWRAVADRAGAPFIEIEVVCSDAGEHRRRVETRRAANPQGREPAWADVLGRTYEPWDKYRDGERVAVDTAGETAAESLAELRAALTMRGL